MTYKELYLKEYPDLSSDELQNVIDAYCPGDFWKGKPDVFGNCPNIDNDEACFECWNREIPEEKTTINPETQPGLFEHKVESYTLNPVDEKESKTTVFERAELTKGDVLELTTGPDNSFQKTFYEFLAEEPEKAKELWEKVNSFLRPDPVELKDINVKPEPVTLEEIRKLGPSPVPVYCECPHYDERTETCGDHMDRERCVCGGDMLICDFFPAKRDKANAKIIAAGIEQGINDVGEVAEKAEKAMSEAISAIKDSGTRREFSTGAVRDIQEGKGRCDLMPLDVVAELMTSPVQKDILNSICDFQETGEDVFLKSCLFSFIEGHVRVKDTHLGNTTTALLEVAKHFEAGAAKYGEYNWQKGIPTHCYIDSAVRHYLKFLRGDKDEPHDRAFVWNILCCIWTCKHKPGLNDYPRKEKTDE